MFFFNFKRNVEFFFISKYLNINLFQIVYGFYPEYHQLVPAK